MNLYLLRHTCVDIPQGTCYGQTDVDLAPSFSEEKEEVLKKLKPIAFSRIYASPLKRCRLLASEIGPVIYDSRLMELHFGEWEGKAWDEISKTPEAGKWFKNYIDTSCPGGESYRGLLERVKSFVGHLHSLPDNENILVVAHGGTIRCIWALANNKSPEAAFNLKVDYGEIIQVTIQGRTKPKLHPIMFVGTGSDVGKSVINAAFCRILKQDGFEPAPFKAQNMSLNSYATKEGLEIGRAQAMQAEACGIDCLSDMNPVLLKPNTYQSAQVVLNGKPLGNQTASDYFLGTDRDWLFARAMEAYHRLAAQYNPIVIEGAGSISEINLRDKDITNMRVALETNAAVFLVTDIDRGGIFGSVYGTLLLLPPEERKLVRGIIVNKFRGDIALFEDGRRMLQELTGIPVVSVIPWFNDIFLDHEDSVVLDSRKVFASQSKIKIAVVLFKHMSNFTDFNSLERIEDVCVNYAAHPNDIENADIIIIPGSKSTIADLHYIRQTGMAKEILRAHADGKSVYGICGGYQMMGREIHDPWHIESDIPVMPGLGILPVSTTITNHKTTEQRAFRFLDKPEICNGYEIHMGETSAEKASPLCTLENGKTDGYYLNHKTWGTYMHGIFDNKTVINEIISSCGKTADINLPDYNHFKEDQYNKLAEHVRKHSDVKFILSNLKNSLAR